MGLVLEVSVKLDPDFDRDGRVSPLMVLRRVRCQGRCGSVLGCIMLNCYRSNFRRSHAWHRSHIFGISPCDILLATDTGVRIEIRHDLTILPHL